MIFSRDINQDIHILYQNLRNDIKLKRNIKDSTSVLCELISMSSGDRLQFLRNSQIDVTEPSEFLKYKILEQNGVTRRIHQKNKIEMIFTVKGLFDIEAGFDLIDNKRLLDFIQKKYFDMDVSNKKLNAKEKAVLLSLITMHCFGQDNAMDLATYEKQEIWYKLINEEIFQYLQKEGMVSPSEKLAPDTTGNETPATYLMRRRNDLSKKTAGIFNNPGSSIYYLSLSLDNPSQTQNLISFLFELILPSKVSYETLQDLKKFITTVFRDYVPIIQGKINENDEIWSETINHALDWVLLQ